MNERSIRTKLRLSVLLMTCLSACHGAPAIAPRAPAAAHPPPQPQPALDSNASPPQAGTLDAARRRLVLDGIAQKLEAHYVYLDVALRMREALEAHAAAGAYEGVIDGPAFAALLTQHLHEVSRDGHLGVTFGRPSWAAPPPPREERLARWRRRNFWFGEIERLSGDVARIVIDRFVAMAEPEVSEAIGSMMTRVADARALIVDLRDNQGGEPETVAFVAGYLFDATPVHLSDIYRRDAARTWPTRCKPSSGRRWWASRRPAERIRAMRIASTTCFTSWCPGDERSIP